MKRSIALGILMVCGALVWADYPADRKAAIALANTGKDEDALASFIRMADATASVAQKTDALEQAALCAQRLKKPDLAMELAGKIPQAPMAKAVRMRLMLENRQSAELVATYKAEDLAGWPERAAGEAFYFRGQAYIATKDYASGAADLTRALDNLGEGPMRDIARLALADNYRGNLNDDARALALYREGVNKSCDAYGYVRLTCILSAADILRLQGRPDEALRVLQSASVEAMSGHWGAAMIAARGEVLVSQGKKAEALDKFKAALAVKGIQEQDKTAFEKRIEELAP
jgi:hypothetical protein